MTPAELTAARGALRMTAADLGRALELTGRDPGRYIRAYEAAAYPIPGPVAVAVALMLAEKARHGLQEALQQAGDTQAAVTAHAVAQALQDARQRRAAENMPPVPQAMTELMQIPPRTRRRG